MEEGEDTDRRRGEEWVMALRHDMMDQKIIRRSALREKKVSDFSTFSMTFVNISRKAGKIKILILTWL